MELAMEKGAGMVLLPVSCRRALVDLSDDVATRVQAFFHLECSRRAAEGIERKLGYQPDRMLTWPSLETTK
jgi:hypothetical protein